MIPKTCRMIDWNHQTPEPGEYMQSQGGSLYLILALHFNARPDPKSAFRLDLGKLDPDERAAVPDSAVIHQFRWNAR